MSGSGLERTVKKEQVIVEPISMEVAFKKVKIQEKCYLCGTQKTNRKYSPCKDCGETICDSCMTEDEYGHKICYDCHNKK